MFFADSGSVSVEVAMKMAWQAHAAGGLTRTKFFTIRGGYHGDTFSPMSVTDPDGGMHAMYAGFLPPPRLRPPAAADRRASDQALADWKAATTALYEQHADEIAAVIVEPVLQGAGGMHVYHPDAVRPPRPLARAHGALVIFDEIATGFWRTGEAWAADHCARRRALRTRHPLRRQGAHRRLPDPGRGAHHRARWRRRVDASPAGAMMHGPTFMANPLACAVASASLDLLGSYDVPRHRRAHLGTPHRRPRARLATSPVVRDVRTLGAVGVIELDRPVDVPAVTRAALDRGVWVRPFRNLVYTMPPYVCSDDDLGTITARWSAPWTEVHA